MESIINKRNWKKEKGLTLIETVIALSITTIISVAVVSLSIYASNALYLQRAKDFFIRETSNIASIYVNYDEESYKVAIKDLLNKDVDGYENMTIYYNESFDYATESDYAYYLNVNYSTESLDLISYNAKNSAIYSRSVAR